MKFGGMLLLAALSLAPLSVPLSASAQPYPQDNERSMGFRPGLGDTAQERVPGGRLLVGAYTVALVLIGGYVASVARRAAKLEDDLRRLEDDLARRTPKEED